MVAVYDLRQFELVEWNALFRPAQVEVLKGALKRVSVK